MLSGLFGDPLWCVLFAYLHKNFAYDTLSHMPSRHTHTLSQSEPALNLLCWIQSSRVEIYVWVIMKIICNNTKKIIQQTSLPHEQRVLCSVLCRLVLVSSVGSAWCFVRFFRMQHKSFISSQCALALFGTAQMDINSWQQFWRFSWMMMMMYSLLPTGFIFN